MRSRNPVIGALLAASFLFYAAQLSAVARADTASTLLTALDTTNCSARPIGETAVATLRNAPIITLLANGKPITLLLDTGAERTILTPAVAQRLGAEPPRIEFPGQMRGIAGTLPSREVELQTFVIGGISLAWRRIAVAPIATARVFSAPLDGLLGADVLSAFDIDLDLPHHRLALYEKRSCPYAPPWAGPLVAISTGKSRGEHLFFPVRLDGGKLVAIIDTGAQLTTISTAAALGLGVAATALRQDRAITTEGATAERLNSHLHRFSELVIGTTVIHSPEIVVTDIKLRDADIILGVDLLSSRRIWLSYGSLQIFFSTQ